MKAKMAAARIMEKEGQEEQEKEFVLVGFEHLRETARVRFPKGIGQLGSIMSLRKDFTIWVIAVKKAGPFFWIADDMGKHLFVEILRQFGETETLGAIKAMEARR